MTKIVSLHDGGPIAGPGQPDPGLVKALEELIADAKEGHVRSIAAVIAWSDGTCGHVIEGQFRPIMMIGAIELMKRDI